MINSKDLILLQTINMDVENFTFFQVQIPNPNVVFLCVCLSSNVGKKEAPSICVASYPTSTSYGNFRDESLEKEVDFVQKVIYCLRSTRADYNLPNKTKTDLYLRVYNDKSLAESLKRYSDVIATLGYSSQVCSPTIKFFLN